MPRLAEDDDEYIQEKIHPVDTGRARVDEAEPDAATATQASASVEMDDADIEVGGPGDASPAKSAESPPQEGQRRTRAATRKVPASRVQSTGDDQATPPKRRRAVLGDDDEEVEGEPPRVSVDLKPV
jgi:hypothetical protein